MELIFKEEAYAITGAAMEVYNELGPGYLEPAYQEAMEIELTLRGIQFEAQKVLTIYYKGRPLKKYYIADLLIIGKIIVEIKVEDELTKKNQAQIINYLKCTNLQLGLLVNFGAYPDLQFKRIINKYYDPSKPANLKPLEQCFD